MTGEHLVQTRREAAERGPVDLAHLRRFTMGNRALESEVLQLFVEQAPVTLAALRAAVDSPTWKNWAHTLKGSARAVGAWRVAEVAGEAEQATFCRGALDMEKQIARIEAAVDEARQFILAL